MEGPELGCIDDDGRWLGSTLRDGISLGFKLGTIDSLGNTLIDGSLLGRIDIEGALLVDGERLGLTDSVGSLVGSMDGWTDTVGSNEGSNDIDGILDGR